MKTYRLMTIFTGLIMALLLGACGSGSGVSGETGDLELAITDAEEDFLAYQIELESITLNRRDGTQVDVLPLRTEVDFVQYQELSELFAVLSVPVGVYESITLGLDYSDANIVIQDEVGQSYIASVIDADGEAITKLNVELQFDREYPVVISPRRSARLTLDLDLAASNTIESFSPPLVSVEPFMLATAELDAEREHRVRGLLDGVDSDAQTVSLNVRPMRLRQGPFGSYTFAVNDQTHYEINGQEYNGEEGLSILAQIDMQTPLVAYGYNVAGDDLPYLASQVSVGTSVPWNNYDVLKGVVSKRLGNVLTIDGAVIEAAGVAGHFRQEVELEVSEDSIVSGYRLGDSDIANLSVGQRVLAMGEYLPEDDRFDAREGVVRMRLNSIVGEVVHASPLKVDLSHINRRPASIFDFSGTGMSTPDDADPDNYELETYSLDISNIASGEWLQARGYPSAFGVAPADFEVLSLINPDFSSHAAKLHVHWSEDAENALTIENDVINLDLDEARDKLHLVGVPASSALDLNVKVISGSTEAGVYALLGRGKGIHIYKDFGDFVRALADLLEEGYQAKHLTSGGLYESSDLSMTSKRMTVVLRAPSNTL